MEPAAFECWPSKPSCFLVHCEDVAVCSTCRVEEARYWTFLRCPTCSHVAARGINGPTEEFCDLFPIFADPVCANSRIFGIPVCGVKVSIQTGTVPVGQV